MKSKVLLILLIVSVLLVSGCANAPGDGNGSASVDVKAGTKLDVTTTVEPKSKEPVKIASFHPQGDFWATFTLDGDDMEFSQLFTRYGGEPGTGNGNYLMYTLIPQGYLGDVGNEFILTDRDTTHRFKFSGFATKSVTLTDQYGTTFKVDLSRGDEDFKVDAETGKEIKCIQRYSGTLNLVAGSYPVEYYDSNCISDQTYIESQGYVGVSGYTTTDQLIIGKAEPGPIRYHLKDNIQIELKDELKEGPLTVRPVPVFNIKSCGKVLYEVVLRFDGNSIVDVFDKGLNDGFTDKESELIVGGWEIFGPPQKPASEYLLDPKTYFKDNKLLLPDKGNLKLVTPEKKYSLAPLSTVPFEGFDEDDEYTAERCAFDESVEAFDTLHKLLLNVFSGEPTTEPPTIATQTLEESIRAMFGVEYEDGGETKRDVEYWSFLTGEGPSTPTTPTAGK